MKPHGVPKQEMKLWYGATTGKTSWSVRFTAPWKKISFTLVMPACMVMTPLVGQPVTDQGVELLGEEQAGRPFLQGLHEVDDDEVEALGGLLEIGPGVLVQQPGPGVVEGPLVHLGQVLLALLDHLAVDVHHEAVGDRLVAEDLPDRGAFAPADDHGLLGPGVGQEARAAPGSRGR